MQSNLDSIIIDSLDFDQTESEYQDSKRRYVQAILDLGSGVTEFEVLGYFYQRRAELMLERHHNDYTDRRRQCLATLKRMWGE